MLKKLVALSLLLAPLAALQEQTRFAQEQRTFTQEEQATETCIGIDLGTTYSCVGVFQDGRVQILENDQGHRTTPSYVAWTTHDGERLLGDAAKNQASVNPENTIFQVKRLIGRKFSDSSVQEVRKLVPYTIVEDNDRPYVQVSIMNETRMFSPEEISGMILSNMKQTAERKLGKEITEAVVTVPAYFNDAQRQATKDAGTIAGLKVRRIINEPTAAAIAFGYDAKLGGERNVLVFDLGGGTFDVTLLTVEHGIFEVLSTSGDTHLGGEDFDQRVMEYFIRMLERNDGIDISDDARALLRLRRETERVKRVLSSQHQARLEITSLREGFDFSETLSRARFEELNMDLFQKTLDPVRNVLRDADMSASEIDEVVLVGGSTRIPKIQSLMKDFLGGKDPSHVVNPDEAVAYGAAIQGAIISGHGGRYTDPMAILDVTPLSTGIETVGGVMTKLIERNTLIPTRKSKIFSTQVDNQETVGIHVFQGERAMTKDNHFLAKFDLTGIPPAPRRVPQIEVTFEVDINGILQVRAEEKGTGKTEMITITSQHTRLSEEDVQRMAEDAEHYAEEDLSMKSRIDSRDSFESRLHCAKSLLLMAENIPDEDRVKWTSELEDATEWLYQTPLGEVEDYGAKITELVALVYPFGDARCSDLEEDPGWEENDL